jgi:ANTAR domain-containing protein
MPMLQDPRDLEIEQLRRALSSRVLIEQAKGVLAERFGLSMQDAFELLRQAARSHRVKVHVLAEQIVRTRATPPAVVDAVAKVGLARPKTTDEAFLTEESFAHLNAALVAAYGAEDWSRFICECADPRCSETITLSAEALSRIHESPRRYVVKDGHEVLSLERVVEQIDGLVIVEKPDSS